MDNIGKKISNFNLQTLKWQRFGFCSYMENTLNCPNLRIINLQKWTPCRSDYHYRLPGMRKHELNPESNVELHSVDIIFILKYRYMKT